MASRAGSVEASDAGDKTELSEAERKAENKARLRAAIKQKQQGRQRKETKAATPQEVIPSGAAVPNPEALSSGLVQQMLQQLPPEARAIVNRNVHSGRPIDLNSLQAELMATLSQLPAAGSAQPPQRRMMTGAERREFGRKKKAAEQVSSVAAEPEEPGTTATGAPKMPALPDFD